MAEWTGDPEQPDPKPTQDVFDYIEMFCNPNRRRGSAGHLASVEYEKQYSLRQQTV